MPDAQTLWLFALASVLLALTPGPNWLYLVSRTLCQGRRAGLVSLAGTTTGVSVHMLAAALGLTALAAAVPTAFDIVRYAGAAYLLWLAWTTIRGAGFSFAPRALAAVPDQVLFRDGMASGVLNPKVALFYLALFPQFVDPERGSVLAQSIVLGVLQVVITILIDAVLVLVAGAVSRRLARHPLWLRVQRWTLGAAFGVLAGWLVLGRRAD